MRYFSLSALFVGVGFLLFACSTTNIMQPPSMASLRIVKTTIAKDVKPSGMLSLPISPTTKFTTDNDSVISHVVFTHLFGKHSIRWDWYDPQGKLYESTDDFVLESPRGKYIAEGATCHSMRIKGTEVIDNPGGWSVKIYIDDALSAIDDFVIKPVEIEAANSVPDVSNIDFGRYHALVIGNNKYNTLDNLKSANNDARAVANTLKNKYGFDVNLKLDATRSDVILALDILRKILNDKDNLLIYYAGHGWLDKDGDEGYWLPVDADKETTLNWISNSKVTSTIKAIPAKHVLIVADSCYSGKMTRNLRGLIVTRSNNYYASITRKRTRSVLCSGGLEPVIDSGGKSGHSIFASAFLDVLNNNRSVMDGTELFSKIRHIVKLEADQTPEYSDIRRAGHDGGDFLFVRKHFLKRNTDR